MIDSVPIPQHNIITSIFNDRRRLYTRKKANPIAFVDNWEAERLGPDEVGTFWNKTPMKADKTKVVRMQGKTLLNWTGGL